MAGLVFISLSVLVSFVSGDICVRTGGCRCEFSNGTGIDLSSSATKMFYVTKIYKEEQNATATSLILSTFYFHPCTDIPLNVEKFTPEDTCKGNISFCRRQNTLSKNNSDTTYEIEYGPYELLGHANLSQFSKDGKFLIYTNVPVTNYVELQCVEGQSHSTLGTTDLTDPQNLKFTFYSPDACLKQFEVEDSGRSLGSTLLIIFFSLLVFYIVLGIGTKKFLMGATGIEVIPNLGFWTDLPNLVKDGWAFAVNGFKLPARGSGPVTTPDPNSYDSI